MTILIGAVYDNTIYMGADTLWTYSENFVRESKTSKFVSLEKKDGTICEELIIASSGQDKFTQILQQAIKKAKADILRIRSDRDVEILVSAFFREVENSGVGEADNNQLPDHDMGFLLASKYLNKVFAIESDYGIGTFDDFICAGSGAFLGESAMRALAKSNVYGEEAVRRALETVNELHPYCGGRIELRTMAITDPPADEDTEAS